MMWLVLFSTLSAAPSPVGVVVSKRSGVSAPLATARATTVRDALGARFAEAPVEDFTQCGGKRPCLVNEARSRQWKALVLVETATILNEALVNVTVLSIDEGREVAASSLQAADEQLARACAANFTRVRDELERLAPPPKAPDLVATPAPVEPTPKLPQVAQPEPSMQKPFARWLPAAGGLVLAGVGAGLFIASKDVARRLDQDTFSETNTPRQLAANGQLLQSLGSGLLVAGSAITLGGVLLALLWPDAPVSPVTIISTRGASLGLVGVFP